MEGVVVTKADGTQEPFDVSKLLHSLIKAGASDDLAQSIAQEVSASLTPGVKTSVIYRNAFSLLRKKEPRGVAARYSLKRAVVELGPTGFPFEAYLAELFRVDGYEATTNRVIRGKCVEHEIDVLLSKNNVRTYIEAKFHNTLAFKTDLKVVLYVKARIDDLRERDPSARGAVVTNTKFTSMAIDYGACQGLTLIDWEYPEKDNLHVRIDRAGLYPITALSTLSKREKMDLMAQKIVLCKQVPQSSEALRRLGIGGARSERIMDEVGALCPGV